MGTVLFVFKVYPDGPEEVENVKKAIPKAIPKSAKLEEIRTEPLAFGMSIHRVGITTPDKKGMDEKLQKALEKIKGVSQVELEASTLI